MEKRMHEYKTINELEKKLTSIGLPVFGANQVERWNARALLFLCKTMLRVEAGLAKKPKKRSPWQEFLSENMGKGLTMGELGQQWREIREAKVRMRGRRGAA